MAVDIPMTHVQPLDDDLYISSGISKKSTSNSYQFL